MKTVIHPVIVKTESELKQALDADATVIYIENPMYSSIIESVKRTAKGKIMSGGGLTAALLGLLVISGPLAWIIGLGGAAVAALGSSMDSLKGYNVDVNEVSNRIMLFRKSGKNKYKSSQHEIVNL